MTAPLFNIFFPLLFLLTSIFMLIFHPLRCLSPVTVLTHFIWLSFPGPPHPQCLSLATLTQPPPHSPTVTLVGRSPHVHTVAGTHQNTGVGQLTCACHHRPAPYVPSRRWSDLTCPPSRFITRDAEPTRVAPLDGNLRASPFLGVFFPVHMGVVVLRALPRVVARRILS